MKRHMHRGRQEHKEIRDQAKMAITLDHNFAMSEFVGVENGLKEEEFEELTPQLARLDQQIKTWRASADIGFFDLPYR